MIKLEKINAKSRIKKEVQEISKQIIDFVNQKENLQEFETELKTKNFDLKNTLACFNEEKKEKVIFEYKNIKFEIIDKFECLLKFLDKLHVKYSFTDMIIKNKIAEKMLKISKSQFLRKEENFITNGDIVIRINDIEFLKTVENINIQTVLYKEAEEIKDYKIYQNKDYTIFYKNKSDYYCFNSQYFDLFKKDIEKLYIANKIQLLIFNKNHEFIGVIMKIDDINGSILKTFDFASDMEEIETEEGKIINLTDDLKKAFKKEEEVKKVVSKKISVKKEKLNKIKHYNLLTGKEYHGNNLITLAKSGYKEHAWIGSRQAKQIGKQVKNNAIGVYIHIYKENENGNIFSKLEKIYNVSELENIVKIENTENYKNMIAELKEA